MSGSTWNDALYQELQKGIKRKKQARILKVVGVVGLVTGVFIAGYILRPMLETPATRTPAVSPIAKSGSASTPIPIKSAKSSPAKSSSAKNNGGTRIAYEMLPVDGPFLFLATGTEIIPYINTSGRGTLTIKNGTGEDAAVKLVDTITGLPTRFVYVQGGGKFTVKGIGSGVYFLRYTQGTGWDTETHAFQKNTTYSEFLSTLDFTEKRYQTSIEYHDYTVTLNKVLHGNARTRRIIKEQF